MPKVNVEILRTVTVTREENVIVELNVPRRVLGEGDVLGWVDDIMEMNDSDRTASQQAVAEAVTGAEWEVADEDESVEYNEATEMD